MTARSFSIAVTMPLTTRAFEGLVLAAERFVEQRREIVAGRKCRSGHKISVFQTSDFHAAAGHYGRTTVKRTWKPICRPHGPMPGGIR